MYTQDALAKIDGIDFPGKDELREQLQVFARKKITEEQQATLQELRDALDSGVNKRIQSVVRRVRRAFLDGPENNQVSKEKGAQKIFEILKNPDFYTPENIKILEDAFGMVDIAEISSSRKPFSIEIDEKMYEYSQGLLIELLASTFFEKSLKPVRTYLSLRKRKVKHNKAMVEAKKDVEEGRESPTSLFKNPDFYTPKNIKILENAFGLTDIAEISTEKFDDALIILGSKHHEFSQHKLMSLLSHTFFGRKFKPIRPYLSLRKKGVGHEKSLEEARKIAENETENDPNTFFKIPDTYTPENIKILEEAFGLADIADFSVKNNSPATISIGTKIYKYSQASLIKLLSYTYFDNSQKFVRPYLTLRKKNVGHQQALMQAKQVKENDPIALFKDPGTYTPENIRILEQAFGLTDITELNEKETGDVTIIIKGKTYEYSQSKFGELASAAFCGRSRTKLRGYLSLRKKKVKHEEALLRAEKEIFMENDPLALFKDPGIYTPENIRILEHAFGLTDITNISTTNRKEVPITINGKKIQYSQGKLINLLTGTYLNNRQYLFRPYLGYRKEGIDHKTAIEMALQGEDAIDDLENEELAKLGVEELIAALQHSPKKLALALKLYHPELTDEKREQLLIRTFRNLSTRANETKEQQYLKWPEELPDITIETRIPKRTEENMLTIQGTTQGAEYVFVSGCHIPRVRVDENGRFSLPIPLKTGEKNEVRIMGLKRVENPDAEEDEDNNVQHWIRSEQWSCVIEQTGTPDDIDALIGLIGNMRSDLLQDIQKNPGKTKFLVDQFEHILIKKFSRSFDEGKEYVEALQKKHEGKATQTIFRKVLENFRRINATKFPGVHPERNLYFFQKYCIRMIRQKIASGELGFILANAPGTGKTGIVLVALQDEIICVIAPNAVVSGWEEEAHECLENPDILAMREMPANKRKQLLRENPDSDRVMNREFLRDTEDEERFELASRPDITVVIDEGHSLSHLDSLQTQGVKKLKRKFLLVVTASPAKNPEMLCKLLSHFYPKDKRFSSTKAFNAAFPSDDPAALRSLNLLLQKHMVRFTEDDVLETMDPKIAADKQKDKLPGKENVDPDKKIGSFTMHPKQAQSIYELFLNYPEWLKKYGKNFPHKKDRIAQLDQLYAGDQLTKKHAMRQIIDNPKYVGVNDADPKAEKVKEIVDLCDKEGRPPVIFCTYNSQTEKYAAKFANRDPALYTGLETAKEGKYKRGTDGNPLTFKHASRKAKGKPAWEFDPKTGEPIQDDNGTPMHPLDYHRLRFQNAKKCKMLIGTYKAGSEGTTFTKGKAIIRDDLEEDYLMRYQADGRIHRIDHRHPTHTSVKYYSLVSKYPEEFLEDMKKRWVVKQKDGTYREYRKKTDAEAAAGPEVKVKTAYATFFEQGTWDQVQHANLQTQQEMFHILHEGIGDESLLNIDQIKFKALNGK